MNITGKIQQLKETARDTGLLRDIVDIVRPPRRKKILAAANLRGLNAALHGDEQLRLRVNAAITNVITKADLQYIFSESGLITGSGFFAELRLKMVEKMLPLLLPENDLRIRARKVFSKSWDYKWVNLVDEHIWIELFRTIRPELLFDGPSQPQQLVRAAETLSFRIAALGLDNRIIQKAGNIINPLNAFTEQNKIWQSYRTAMQNTGGVGHNQYLEQLMLIIDTAFEQVAELRKAKRDTGTSLQQTFIIERIHQQLQRLKIIITIIDPQIDVTTVAYTEYFRKVVESENTHKKIGPFISTNFSYLAYQIAEHGSRTGEKYITNNLKEYLQFFRMAMVGGLVISFAALVKMWLGHYHWAPFWASFFFGVNYATAFVVIHIIHGSIATKQPALTASAIATALDNTGQRSPSMNNMALMIGKVFRSQLASLLGNLVIVFPLSIGIAWLVHHFTNQHLVDPDKAIKVLHDTAPSFRNIWFACIAAFLLFLSGIISGYFDNMVVFGRIPQRIRAHRRFTFILGAKGTIRLANYIDKNLGAVMGNIFLGFALGFVIFFGTIFALPLDIRHVTISTGFFGFTAFAKNFALTGPQWTYYIFGLVFIALTNLLVSFGLALFVAMKSRRVATSQLGPLIRLTFKYFLKHPIDFLFPPRKERVINNAEK